MKTYFKPIGGPTLIIFFALEVVKSITAQKKCFPWQVQQDILPIGSRLHCPGADKRCLAVLENNRGCTNLIDRQHVLLSCL